MDVVQAFLCAPLREEIYVEPPEGAGEPPDTVWRLNKALYGLKQAPAAWEAELSKVLVEKMGFRRLDSEHGIYIRGTGNDLIMLAVYVDDIVIAHRCSKSDIKVGPKLHQETSFDVSF